MHRFFLFLFITIQAVSGQYLFTEPRVSGTPLTPRQEQFEAFLEYLRQNNPERYRQLQLSPLRKAAGLLEERTFQVLNLVNPDKMSFDEKVFVLKKQDSRVNIWVEKAEIDNNHVTDTVIDQVYDAIIESTPASSLDPSRGIYEISVDVFGSPPDVDGNGHVNFLLTDIQDGWEDAGDTFIGGFFYAHDQTTQPGSNRSDIIYMDTYPGIYGEDQNGDPTYNVNGVLGTVAHEFQHLIQFRNDPDEETWANEGFSEIASFFCGYGLRSPDRYLQSISLSLTDWDRDNSLPHYARVALWQYFVYEKYGLEAVRQIVRAPQPGINGFNQGLQSAGVSKTFADLVREFFKILSSNVPGESDGNVFSWEALQYIQPQPLSRVTTFPFSKSYSVKPYSLTFLEVTNGDSLIFSSNSSFAGNVWQSRLGFGLSERLVPLSTTMFSDNDFGRTHHTQQIFFANNTSRNESYGLTFDASPAGRILELSYAGDEPDVSLTSDNNTNAIKYFAPENAVLLKSVSFYKSAASSDIRLHVYTSRLSDGSVPSSAAITVPNVVASGWVRFDLEDFRISYDEDEEIAVGVEFLTEGAMGYDSDDGNSGRSYIKGTITNGRFRPLTQFTSGGNSLNGVWMMNVEVSAPGGSKVPQEPTISRVALFPNPYPAGNGTMFNIEYSALGSGIADLDIFDVNGRKVYSASSSLNGLFQWDGQSNDRERVASGVYIVRVKAGKKAIFSRFLLLR